MKIEAVIVCVNYSDFLEISLKKNLNHFDHVIVITDTKDSKTPKLVQKLNAQNNKITTLITDIFYFNGAKFNKGLAINLGFANLQHKDWVVTLDSDIVLPKDFRTKFEKIPPNPESSYVLRRYDIPTFDEWVEVENDEEKLKSKKLYRGAGYGYFFCFNYNSTTFQRLNMQFNGYPYPYWFTNGSESDWVFRNYWSDWLFDPPMDGTKMEHDTINNDRPANPELSMELPMYAIHLGLTGFNSERRITPKFQ